jgi:colanic acid/amylovoran biosynthesis protein
VNVVVTNAVSLNGGDAAILAAEHRLLREAFGDATIQVVDSQAKVASRLYPEFRFVQHLYDGTRGQLFATARRRAIRAAANRLARGDTMGLSPLVDESARRTLAAYRDADIVVSTGGTYLVEHYELEHRFFELEIAASFGAPLVFFTQSLGPFAKPENRAPLRSIFGRAALVLLRDPPSKRHLLELGIAGDRLHVHADAAFVLGTDAAIARMRTARLPARGAKVAISVRHWQHFSQTSSDVGMRRYQEAMALLTQHLVRDRGARVTFISTCQGIPEYWTNDARTAREIVDLLAPEVRNSVVIDGNFHRPDALCEIFAGMDLVVATRMHAAILALVAGTPVLPVAYETKTSELFESLSFGDLVLELESITPDRAVDACRSFYETIDERRNALADAIVEQRTSARGVVGRLRSVSLNR